MSDPQNREEAIFDAALQLPAAERAACLDRACGKDAGLRQRVEALLRSHEQSDGVLDQPAAPAPRATIVLSVPLTEKAGNRIGRYKLLQQIGEGGCGVVYMAEQEEPVRRRVALKVIKLGMDTKSVIARFEAERQALALMDHPNIAKVLDAGGTETGRPYFVMELVRGIKITEYCDQNKLSTEERLKLFVQVCHAIQHAHQKGIIHRDIKPSNILVTLHDGVPVPKVIDFGIAKATQGRLTDQTLFTAFEQFIGTPAYMSPEQAEMSGLDIDTRCDIYALGVLLYELLTGQTPFDAKELLASGLDKMRQTIREKEPERPSTRLGTMLNADLTNTAIRRHTDAPRLVHLLRGDLDWIVMKSLEKDRTRRYETANGFAMDIQRHLTNEPVFARPPSNLYRFQKLVRRNKTAVAAAAIVAVALFFSMVFCLFLLAEERRAYRRLVIAEQEQARMRQQAERDAGWSRQIAQAGLLLMRDEFDEAESIVSQVPPHASTVPLYNVFGLVHAQRGEWRPAITNYQIVIQLAPKDSGAYVCLAGLYALVADARSYARNREQMLQICAGTTNTQTAVDAAGAALILPPPPGDFAAINALMDCALAPRSAHRSWAQVQLIKALAEYRQGRYAAAADWLRNFSSPDAGVGAIAQPLLAMTQHQLGQIAASRVSLSNSLQLAEARLSRVGKRSLAEACLAHALIREAQELIEGPERMAELKRAAEIEALRSRALDEGRKGGWSAATADLKRLQQPELDPQGTWYQLAAILLYNGDVEGYRQLCHLILDRYAQTSDPALARRIAKACLLLPASGADLAVADRLAETALTQESEWVESSKALAEYRQGRFASAVEWGRKSLARTANERRDAQVLLLLAMAQQQLNQPAAARESFKKGVEMIDTKLPKLDSGDLGPGWIDRIIAEIFLREAKGLIEGVRQ